MSWSRYALLAGIVLALVLVIPTAWFPFQLSKVAVFAVASLIAAVLFIISGGARDLLRTHGFYAALAIGALPLMYLLSWAFSTDRSVAVSGFGIETDTVVFVAIAALAYLLSFTMFRTLRTARMLTMVVFWSLIAAVIFQYISIIIGTPFSTFTDRSVNLIGKWNDLGLLSSLLMVLLFARVELGVASNLWRIGAWIGGGLLLILMALVNFPVAWSFLLVGSLVVGLLAYMRIQSDRRAEGAALNTLALPWYSVAGAVFAVIFLLYGGAVNSALTKIIPVSSLEVRPGIGATLDVVSKAREGSLQRAFFGTGPNTFGQSWLAHKPTEVNQTPFWNLDFNVGFSTLATAFGSVGFLGAIAWLMPLFLLIAALIRAYRLGVLSRDERVVAAMLSIGALFLLATLVFYVPSQNIVLLAFVLSGAAFGFLWRQGQASSDDAAPSSMLQGIGILAIAAAILIVAVVSSFITTRRFVAEAYTGAGLYELSQGHVDESIVRANRALAVEQNADALRLATDAGAQKLVSIAQDTKLTPEQARSAFTTQVQTVIPAAQAAIAAAPRDYRAYFSLARVYDFLASLKVDGAYTSAQAAYASAAERNPTSPAIPLALARLEATQGNAANTEKAITKALQLKPDYTDAILFVVQINVANNDLASAIKNTQVAVQTAPGVASIWFELGLLYYAGGDTKDAVQPLEQALVLVPDYANAKYFLGLSYYAQNRQNDALRLFQELAVSNPDNAEIKTIVANLQSGKKPLEGLQPPPEDRSTAPVKQ